jgi:serine/threonine protein kinase
MNSPRDSLIGRQLDEYQIDKPLGQGGMARVYRALDTKLRRYVALKVIAPDLRADAEYAARFEREAQSIARLEHPNIVRIYRFGEVAGLYYMAMQYVEGADVAWLIEDYRRDGELMAIPDVVRVVKDIGAALDYAHSKNVIHRDIKPGNIIVNKQGRAVLTDFGLALLSDVGTRGEIFGSPSYISPEQAISSSDVVPQSDLYSLGVTLFEMLTGELPFTGGQPMDIAMRHVTEPAPAPSQFNKAIPSGVDAVVLRSLEKEPHTRYQTGAEFGAALEQAVTNWQTGSQSSVPGVRRPSLVVAPQKVSELLKSVPLPALPPHPPGVPEPPPLSPVLVPSLATTRRTDQQTDQSAQPQAPGLEPGVATRPVAAAATRPVTRSSAWAYPVLFGGALFACGLVALVVVLLASRGGPSVVSTEPTATSSPIPSPTAIPPTDIPATITPVPTLEPTFTAVVLPTGAAPIAATWTPVVIRPTDPPAIAPTSPPVFAPTDTPIVIQPVQPAAPSSTPLPLITPSTVSLGIDSGKDWVAFVNKSSAVLSLAGFRLQRGDNVLTARDWGKALLLPGECLRIYQKDKPPNDPPDGCRKVFDLPGSKGERDDWFKGKVIVVVNPTTSYCYPSDKCRED